VLRGEGTWGGAGRRGDELSVLAAARVVRARRERVSPWVVLLRLMSRADGLKWQVGCPARHRAEKLLCNGKQGKVGQGKARLGKARETHAAVHMRFPI